MMDDEKKYTESDLIWLTNYLDNYVIRQFERLDRLLGYHYYDDWKTCFSKAEQRELILAAYGLRTGLNNLERFPKIVEYLKNVHRPTVERMEKVIILNQQNKKDELAF